jgi:hypothetical protein
MINRDYYATFSSDRTVTIVGMTAEDTKTVLELYYAFLQSS